MTGAGIMWHGSGNPPVPEPPLIWSLWMECLITPTPTPMPRTFRTRPRWSWASLSAREATARALTAGRRKNCSFSAMRFPRRRFSPFIKRGTQESDKMRKTTPSLREPIWFWPVILFAAALATPSFGQAPITNGLVARWPGDGNAKDSAGHFDGQVSGGLRYGPGLTGQAFEFNGGSSQVDFGPTAGNFGTRDFTIDRKSVV